MDSRKIAIKCGFMLDETGRFLENQIILVEDGKIQTCGPCFDIPADYTVVDASDSWVTPGLIESHGHLNMADANELTANPILPHMSIIDTIDPFAPVIRDIRNAGVTSFCNLPGSGCLIGGTGVAVKLKDAVAPEEMILEECQPLKMALGENPKTAFGQKGLAPFSRMGNAAMIRKAFYDVREKLDKGGADAGANLTRTDKILADCLDGKRIVKIHCHAEQDIITAVRISEEFGYRYTLDHVTIGYRVADYLSKKNVRCCIGPVFMFPQKAEIKDVSPFNPKILAEAGVRFSVSQDSNWEAIYLPSIAGACVAYGLSREKALQSITIEAAENLGLSHRIGSIKAGKDADLAIFDGDPLLNTTHCLMTMIDGVLYRNDMGRDCSCKN